MIVDMVVVEVDKEFVKIFVYVDFVSNYGFFKFYLNKEGIEKFIMWCFEYSDVIFELESGIY